MTAPTPERCPQFVASTLCTHCGEHRRWHPTGRIPVHGLPWARLLDEADRREFLADLASAAANYFRPEESDADTLAAVAAVVGEWQETTGDLSLDEVPILPECRAGSCGHGGTCPVVFVQTAHREVLDRLMARAGDLCGAREPESRAGTGPCVLPAWHGGRHQDKWTNRWTDAPEGGAR